MALACSEACANAIEHAYSPPAGRVQLEATVGDDRTVVLTISDFGRWRPPRGANRGRGMLLMEGLTDAVDVVPREDGTSVRLLRGLEEPAVMIETLRIEPRGELLVARLGGEVDISPVPVVRDRLFRALDNQGDGLVIDLSDTTYIDSAVVNLLFELADRLGPHQLRLAVVVPEGGLVDRVLTIVDIASVVDVYRRFDEAIAACGTEQSPRAPPGCFRRPAGRSAQARERGLEDVDDAPRVLPGVRVVGVEVGKAHAGEVRRGDERLEQLHQLGPAESLRLWIRHGGQLALVESVQVHVEPHGTPAAGRQRRPGHPARPAAAELRRRRLLDLRHGCAARRPRLCRARPAGAR